jgi:hypothetical protein
MDSGSGHTPGDAGSPRPGAPARRRLLKGAGLAGAAGVAGALLQSTDASAHTDASVQPDQDDGPYVPLSSVGADNGVAPLDSDAMVPPVNLPLSATSLFLAGSGAPASSLGLNGDTYADTASAQQYAKASGLWSQNSLVYMGLLASTGTSGFALQATGGTFPASIISWTAPSDGNMHRVAVFLTMGYSSATGGQIKATLTDPGGTARNDQLIAALSDSTGSSYSSNPTCLIEAGSTFTLEQGTGLSAGTATIWAEIWGS